MNDDLKFFLQVHVPEILLIAIIFMRKSFFLTKNHNLKFHILTANLCTKYFILMLLGDREAQF